MRELTGKHIVFMARIMIIPSVAMAIAELINGNRSAFLGWAVASLLLECCATYRSALIQFMDRRP